MNATLKSLLAPLAITLLLFLLLLGIGRLRSGGPAQLSRTTTVVDLFYIFSPEGRAELPAAMDSAWLSDAGITLASGDLAQFIFDDQALHLHSTWANADQLSQWLDANLGPEEWHYATEINLDLTFTLAGRRWGLEGVELWVNQKPSDNVLEPKPAFFLSYGYNWHSEKRIFGSKDLYLSTQRLSCAAPAWPALLLLCAFPAFLLHILRRPLLRILNRRSSRL